MGARRPSRGAPRTDAKDGAEPASTRDVSVRWGLKLAGLLVLFYYDLPDRVFGVPAYWAFVFGILVVLLAETLRLGLGVAYPAVRPYEARRPAGYVYWGASLALLVAFFPRSVAVAALLAAAAADIGAAMVRRRGASRGRGRGAAAPLFAGISIVVLLELSAQPWTVIAMLAVIGGLLAAGLEGVRGPVLDDDLLMPLVPALLWVALSWVLPGAVAWSLHVPWVPPSRLTG